MEPFQGSGFAVPLPRVAREGNPGLFFGTSSRFIKHPRVFRTQGPDSASLHYPPAGSGDVTGGCVLSGRRVLPAATRCPGVRAMFPTAPTLRLYP